MRDTVHMTSEQIGCYTLLLCAAWVGVDGCEQGYLPNDDRKLARIARISARKWTSSCAQEILRLFRVSDDGKLYHKRLLQELERQKARSESAKESAEKRWAKERSKKHANASANADKKTCVRNAAREAEDEDEESPREGRGKPEDLSRGFREAFKVWASTLPKSRGPNPKPNGARRAKYEARRREGYDQETILAALTNWIHDPWEGRMQGIGTYDMAVLLRSGATVEKFAAMQPGDASRNSRPVDRGFEVPISHQAQALAQKLYSAAEAKLFDDATMEGLADELRSAQDSSTPIESLERLRETYGL